MRRLILLAALVPMPVVAQEQQALNPPAAQSGAQPGAQAVYDIVAADRETAWRINRVTGDITVCRVETASLDGVRARCAPAVQESGPQQSQSAPGGIRRP
ncbi:MAG: hypothetical protein H7Z12_18080 [Rhodospirillaceae bacterium]|nr:hypothetical protein [Rhodospirillales bacterium]